MEKFLIKLYLWHRRIKQIDIWADGLLIENMRRGGREILWHVYFYGRKSLTADKVFTADRMMEEKDLLQKSKMVVFRGKREFKPMLLERLNLFCKSINHYGLIVDSFSDEVYFFPRLAYQDVFLIKEIFADKFEESKVDVLCGSILL